MMDHVVRAEANMEVMGSDHAVFVDRDPKHFGIILTYLRNKADGLDRHLDSRRLLNFGRNNDAGSSSSSSSSSEAKKEASSQIMKSAPTLSFSSSIILPKDSTTLTELYHESVHYQISELTEQICSQRALTRVFDLLGSKNPFQLATTAITAGKRVLVLLGGMMTTMGGWVYAQALAAQAKTNELMEGGVNGDSAQNAIDYWKKQTEHWKAEAAKWSNGTK